ncbi:riboflavin synthase subunit alpha [Arsukibacterium sp.]|uniref:riboflavin synthase subunit alpha n=1 Tax=Arsukibacterium sp. TaxID=1977258 RepID=UPI002FD95371
MFTGIVQCTAQISQVTEQAYGRRLTLSLGTAHLSGVQHGASIAINGVCLTVSAFDLSEGSVSFDVIAETLAKTNLGQWQVGDWVNVERSLSFGSEIGGHIVSGHVQTMATLTELSNNETEWRLRLTLAPGFMRFILAKGFVAVEGCSLTVGETYADGFSLYLIPETLQLTTLGQKQVGDTLNIECDQQTMAIVQTVERLMAERYAN